MSRYSTKCEYDNIVFDSIPERDFYIKLKKFKKEGRIKDFSVNPTYILQDEFKTDFNSDKFNDVKEKPITYIIDYSVTLNDGTYILVDTKGASGQTVEEVAKIKKKLFQYQHKDTPIFFISKCPNYLSNTEAWVCVNSGSDFFSKLKNKYYNVHPEQKKKRGKKDIQWTIDDWSKYFEFESVEDLFYVWKSTKRIKK